jgi:hypothetical protein
VSQYPKVHQNLAQVEADVLRESLVDVDVLADPDALVLLDVLCESLNASTSNRMSTIASESVSESTSESGSTSESTSESDSTSTSLSGFTALH